MKVFGHQYLNTTITECNYFIKAVCNTEAVCFFDQTLQHRDVKVAGISYEDDYEGNALAIIIKPGVIEIRYHSGYTDSNVLSLIEEMLEDPKMRKIRWFSITYQGRWLRDYR